MLNLNSDELHEAIHFQVDCPGLGDFLEEVHPTRRTQIHAGFQEYECGICKLRWWIPKDVFIDMRLEPFSEFDVHP